MTINELKDTAHGIAKEKGFWPSDKRREFPTLVMLIVSELSEAVEADRKGHHSDIETFRLRESEVASDGDFKSLFEAAMKDGVEDEIADAIIRLFDLAGGLGIDIEYHIKAKMRYNSMRPVRNGKRY